MKTIYNNRGRSAGAGRLSAVALGAALLQVAGVAQADCPASDGRLCATDPGAGFDVCAKPPARVPGMSGMPDYDQPGGRTEFGDPRWGGAAARTLFSQNGDLARYRMLVARDGAGVPQELAVQVHVEAGANSETDSRLYFGMSRGDGAIAYGFMANLLASGSVAAPQATFARKFLFTGGEGGSWAAVDEDLSAPTWLSGLHMWNDANGYTAAFKIDLTEGSFVGNVDQLRFAITATQTMLVADTPTTVQYYTPDLGACGPAADAPCAVDVGAGGQTAEEAFPYLGLHPYPNEWTRLVDLGNPAEAACSGVSISSVGTLTTSNRNVYVNPGQTNTFVARLGDAEYNTVEHNFYMSNWGSVATPAAWFEIPNTGAESNTTVVQVRTTCDNALPDKVCNLPVETNCNAGVCDNRFHQCLMVQLRPYNNSGVNFTNDYKYTNTRFGDLSTLTERAQLSVKGLQAQLGNEDPRDVYLFVRPINMPVAGDTLMELDVPALDALRAQVDPGFAEESGYCQGAGEICFDAVCVPECTNPNGYPDERCDDGRGGSLGYAFDHPEAGCRCFPDYYSQTSCDLDLYSQIPLDEQGDLAAGGGMDSNVHSLDEEAKLASEYPTLMVYAYYATGGAFGAPGDEHVELVAMTKFGLNLKHEGQFYGFLQGMLNEDGTPAVEGASASVGRLAKVAENIYKITVPNEGTAVINVVVSAEESPHVVPFTNVHGNATTTNCFWGWCPGVVSIGGLAADANDVDLDAATVVLKDILDDNGKELVVNAADNLVLNRVSGNGTFGVYSDTSGPDVVAEVFDLGVFGYSVALTVTGADVDVPKSCGWWSIGTASLSTTFELDDGNTKIAIGGEDQWTCVPGALINSVL